MVMDRIVAWVHKNIFDVAAIEAEMARQNAIVEANSWKD